MQRNTVHRLSEYQAPDYLVTHVDLQIDLSKTPIRVKSRLSIQANPECKNLPADLILDGENMKLVSLALEGKPVADTHYIVTDKSLTIKNVPTDKPFTVEEETELGINTDLFGIYQSDGIILAKSETEGLRRVLYCKDRPAVSATYTTTIIADEKQYPILLANGEPIQSEKLSNGTHSVTWRDKVPKASYLFAMVAGNLESSRSYYKKVPIEFYVEKGKIDKCVFAKEILKKTMAWDEKIYDLPCDLPRQMVVGINNYAAGASEPTGLILVQSDYLLASPEMKTDDDFLFVADVISHEYSHYWSGNRVTIRDWHNLTFKEGLTTFRSNVFREDLFGRDIVVITNGKMLDGDAPRPSSYEAVRNLYTNAAYGKSAEIFNMIKIVLGEDVFNKALSQFLKENDGKAVIIEDLLSSLESFSKVDLSKFLHWFTETGIPQVTVSDTYDSESKTYTLNMKQSGSNSNYKIRSIPIVTGLLDSKGNEIANRTLILDKAEMKFTFNDIAERPVPSLLRSFSAPVRLNYEYSNEALLLLMEKDANLYNRREAAQKLLRCLAQKDDSALKDAICKVYRTLLQDQSINEWMLAEIINIPSTLISDTAREKIIHAIAKECQKSFAARLENISQAPPVTDPQFRDFDIREAGKRKLRNVCLTFLSRIELEKTIKFLIQQFEAALTTNMTDSTAALALLGELNCPEASGAFEKFYQQWKHDKNAINYWLKLQPKTVENVRKLLGHPAFNLSNLTNVYTLFDGFTQHPQGLDAPSGEGCRLLSDVIVKLDKINPPVAAHLAKIFVSRATNEQMLFLNAKTVSIDVQEVIKKKLAVPFKELEEVSQLWVSKEASKQPVNESKESDIKPTPSFTS